MKKQISILAAIAFAFGIGFGSANIASGVANPNIAVVNVDKVLTSSAQVAALKKEQEKKSKDLQAWLKNAQADVDKQSTPQTKKTMKEKYEKELAAKRDANKKDFSNKLSAIDKSVTNTITQYAKSKGYSLVLAKNVVIYGGTDITADIAKIVK